MRARMLSVLSMLMIAAPLGAARPDQPTPPGFVGSRLLSSVPAWISLNQVLNLDGTIDWSRLPPGAKRDFDDALWAEEANPPLLRFPPDATLMPKPEGCEVLFLGWRWPSFDQPASDLADLVDHSLAIYRGRVSGRSQGFSWKEPATLIGLGVTDPIKESDEVAKGRVWMIYPSARFTAEGRTVYRWLRAFPPAPQDGDEVLLFVFGEPVDAEGRVVSLADPRFLFIAKKGGGKLIVPYLFLLSGELDGVTTMDGVVQRVRELLAGGRGSGGDGPGSRALPSR